MTARRIHENLHRVRQAISDAVQRSGRAADAVTLVGVTKYVGEAEARALVEAGLLDLGESRPQELWHKAEAMADVPVRWHLIGHLQRNKARRTLALVDAIHSGDSLRILQSLNDEAAALSKTPRTLLEVNISGDAAKHGFSPSEMESVLSQAGDLGHLRIIGLMGMASLEGGRERARRDFHALRMLRDRLRSVCPPRVSLDELSMGMSDDYDLAIEEGATIVRVGSALFTEAAP